MKLITTKTGLKRDFLRIILGFYLFCCCANAQEAHHFLDMLRKTDGLGVDVDSVLGPTLPTELYSNLSNLKKHTRDVEIKPELLSWSSSGQPKIFKDEKINDFFKELFHVIEKSFPDINLDRSNLFHAHLIKASDDYLLIFHAFEYPKDLEPFKFEMAKKTNPQILPFTTKSKSYARRNLIWSLMKNKIWRFDTSLKSKFNFLIRSPAYELYPREVLLGNALQENLFGKSIADLFYFPLEEKIVFLGLFP